MSSHQAFLIDATNYLHRVWSTMPELGRASNLLLDGIEAFVAQGLPRWVYPVAVFDARGKTFRHEKFAGYKAGRGAKDPALVAELRNGWRTLAVAGVELCATEGVEADDLIATLAHQAIEQGYSVAVWSTDKDLRQLLALDGVELVTSGRRDHGEWTFERLTALQLRDKTGVTAEQWRDFRVICGDDSDGWKGALKIGEVGAAELLQRYGTLEKILQTVGMYPTLFKPAMRRGLQGLNAELGCDLMTLRTDAPARPQYADRWPWAYLAAPAEPAETMVAEATIVPEAIPEAPAPTAQPVDPCAVRCPLKLDADRRWRCPHCGRVQPIAADFGIKLDSTVRHPEHGTCTVHHISGDGTNLRLVAPSGELILVCTPDSVQLVEPPALATQAMPDTRESYYAMAAPGRGSVAADRRQKSLF